MIRVGDEVGSRTSRLHGPGDVRVATEQLRAGPEPGEALVAVDAVGICGSDLHWFTEGAIGDAVLERPLVLGHEAAGVIQSGARAGERVAIDPAIPCLRCEPCLHGRRHLCLDQRFAGHGTMDGALRSHLWWPESQLVTIPDRITAVEAVMLEPLGVALHAFDLGRSRPGCSIGVVGCGPIGLLLVALARLSGAGKILACDPLPHRAAAARTAGADVVVAEAGNLAAGPLLEATGGHGVDVVFEVAGRSVALDTAIDLAMPAAKVVIVGIPDEDRYSFRASVARRKGLDLRLSRRMGDVYPRAIELVASGRLEVAGLVTHRFPLAEAGEAFRVAARREGLKVVIEPPE